MTDLYSLGAACVVAYGFFYGLTQFGHWLARRHEERASRLSCIQQDLWGECDG